MSLETVVFVHPSDELYGADRCLLAMVAGRPAATRAVVVLPVDRDDTGSLADALMAAGADVQWLDIAVLRRSGLRPRMWPGLARRMIVGTRDLARLIREVDATEVRTNTLATVAGPIAALLTRRPHVWHVHEDIADEHWSIRLVYRLLALLPGRVIANSWASARALVGPLKVLRRKTRVVYPGLIERSETLRLRQSNEDDLLRVAFIGRLSPRKGVRELLEAVGVAHASGVRLQVSIFGSAPPGQEEREAKYRAMSVRLGITNVVTFEGFVVDARDRLSEFDVLVVPSQRPEPFGLVIVEGMAAGCAVVACRNGGGSDEILTHGLTGLYCGKTPASIAAALARVAGDRALRERLGAEAREEAVERFDLQRYLNRVWENARGTAR